MELTDGHVAARKIRAVAVLGKHVDASPEMLGRARWLSSLRAHQTTHAIHDAARREPGETFAGTCLGEKLRVQFRAVESLVEPSQSRLRLPDQREGAGMEIRMRSAKDR